jgi:hypothetical protein
MGCARLSKEDSTLDTAVIQVSRHEGLDADEALKYDALQ